MIPKSDLFGAVSPTHGHGAPAVHPQLPAELPGAVKNFSVIVSQAIAKRPVQTKPGSNDPRTAPVRGSATVPVAFSGVPLTKFTSVSNSSETASELSSTPEYAEAAEFATITVGEPQTETSKPSKGRARESASVPSDKSDFIDTSVLTSAMASLVQPAVVPPVFRRPTSSGDQDEDLSVKPESDGGAQRSARATAKPTIDERDLAGDAPRPISANADPSNIAKSEGREPTLGPLVNGDSLDAQVSTKVKPALVQPATALPVFRKPGSLQSRGEDLIVKPESDGGAQRSARPTAEAPSKADLPPISANADASKTQTTAEPTVAQSFPDLTGGHTISALIHEGQPVAISTAGTGKLPVPNPSPPENGPPSELEPIDIKTVPIESPNRLEALQPMVGTRAALPQQRMKFAGEKNDIAGSVVQNLPNAASVADSPGNSSDKAKTPVEPSVSNHSRESFFPGSLAYFAANPNLIDALQGKSVAAAHAVDTAAAQVERVAHLVSQEVFMVRQSGANALAVSLKVDSHTELFLQLTHHDGQVQASLRCDRGDIQGLDSHWAELQQSLARQNIQLMPFENRTASVGAPSITPATGTASSLPFDQSSQDRRPQFRDPQDETPMASATVARRVSGKTRTNNRSRQGWEKWA